MANVFITFVYFDGRNRDKRVTHSVHRTLEDAEHAIRSHYATDMAEILSGLRETSCDEHANNRTHFRRYGIEGRYTAKTGVFYADTAFAHDWAIEEWPVS